MILRTFFGWGNKIGQRKIGLTIGFLDLLPKEFQLHDSCICFQINCIRCSFIGRPETDHTGCLQPFFIDDLLQ